jgi:hypothetical protein
MNLAMEHLGLQGEDESKIHSTQCHCRAGSQRNTKSAFMFDARALSK